MINSDSSDYQSLEKEKLVSLLTERDQKISVLEQAIINFRKTTYGSKTEKFTSANQLALKFEFKEVTLPPPAPTAAPVEKVEIAPHKRTVRKGRKPLPDDLERVQVEYNPEATHCECCQGELAEISREVTEELEKTPAQLKVIEHIRIKKACSRCKDKVLIAKLPTSVCPLEGSRPGAGLLADIITSKYVDHLPLHRQEEMYRRKGVSIPRQRMCDWIKRVVELITPIYKELEKEILQEKYLLGDETSLKVQDGETPDKCHTGYLWGAVTYSAFLEKTSHRKVLFRYSKSRGSEVPKSLYDGFRGVLQTDFYAGYNPVYVPETCRRAACLAHIRRKFFELQASHKKESAEILRILGLIYNQDKGCLSAQERFMKRLTKTKLLLDELYSYLEQLKPCTLPKSPLASALEYALKQKDAVYLLLSDGRYELDNNAIERQMKTIAIGRKNYYFAGSHEAAQNAAVLYSLLGTCKLNSIDPFLWLKDAMIRVQDDTVPFSELLPYNWKPQSHNESVL